MNSSKKNGTVECFTAEEPGYIQFWRIQELDGINSEIETEMRAPGYFGFASDGGGEMISFDKTGAIFKLSFIGMEPEQAIRIAESFNELVSRLEFPTEKEG